MTRGGCSFQFGRASAPMIPQRVHTMRGPNDGNRHDIVPGLGTEHRFMVTVPARHRERPHAVAPHVAERHRLDLVLEARHRDSIWCPASDISSATW